MLYFLWQICVAFLRIFNESSPFKCTLNECLPTEIDQTCRSWTSNAPVFKRRSRSKSDKLIYGGVASISTSMQSLRMGMVVQKTRKEQRKVQMGSASTRSESIMIMIAAMTTPIDWIKSPMIWMKAALTLTFALSSLTSSFSVFCLGGVLRF